MCPILLSMPPLPTSLKSENANTLTYWAGINTGLTPGFFMKTLNNTARELPASLSSHAG